MANENLANKEPFQELNLVTHEQSSPTVTSNRKRRRIKSTRANNFFFGSKATQQIWRKADERCALHLKTSSEVPVPLQKNKIQGFKNALAYR